MDKKQLEQRIQNITQSLQASNIGTNKTFLHINGKENDVITNKNAKIQYKLNNPIKLDIGDRVTLYQAFVNEAGLTDQTITFQDDLTETMNFLYYMPSQTYSPVKPTVSTKDSNVYIGGNSVTNSVYAEYLQMPNDLNYNLLSRNENKEQTEGFVDYTGGVYGNTITNHFANGSDNFSGDCGQICYLFENHIKNGPIDDKRTAVNNSYVKPAVGTVTFTIKAGNYSADSLARLITEQINGSTVNDEENYLTNRLYNPDSTNYAGTSTSAVYGEPENGITTSLVYNQLGISGTGTITDPNLEWYFDKFGFVPSDPNDFQLKNDIFVCSDGLDLWERGMKQSTDGMGSTRPIQALDFIRCNVDPNGNIFQTFFPTTRSYTEDPGQPGNERLTGKGEFNIDFENDIPTIARANMIMVPIIPQVVIATIKEGTDLSVLESKIPNRYIGTHSFSVDFSKNRNNFFSIQNLHEPFKLPSVDVSGNATSFGGQQATKYSPPNINFGAGYVRYPIEASMGIMTTNFCYNSVKTTQKYLNDLAELNAIVDKESREYLYKKYLLDTRPFEYFYATEQEAKQAFNNTIWARLGFTYNQLGDFSKKLETVKTQIPTNQFDSTGSPAKFRLGTQKLKGLITHNAFDFSDIQASSGLGPMTNPTGVSTAINVFGTSSYNKNTRKFQTLVSDPTLKDKLGETALDNSVATDSGIFHLLTNSQTLDAETLPSLNAGNAYYLIHSDIIKRNGFDANSEPMNLIGVMSKENSSNDTIFSVEGVENIVTEEKLMTELSIEIKNTDGTIVPNDIIGADSGFILLIEKAIAPDTMPLISI